MPGPFSMVIPTFGSLILGFGLGSLIQVQRDVFVLGEGHRAWYSRPASVTGQSLSIARPTDVTSAPQDLPRHVTVRLPCRLETTMYR